MLYITIIQNVWIRNEWTASFVVELNLTEKKYSSNSSKDKLLFLFLHIPKAQMILQLLVAIEVIIYFGVSVTDRQETESGPAIKEKVTQETVIFESIIDVVEDVVISITPKR